MAPSRALGVTPAELNLSSIPGSTPLMVSSTNVDWIIEEDIDWVTLSPTSGTASGTVTVSYTENTTVTARDGVPLRLEIMMTEAVITHTINISQAGQIRRVPFCRLIRKFLTFHRLWEASLLTVNTNIAWIIEEDIDLAYDRYKY